ncbi:MAG TPA: hypothetical protein VLC91_12670 [Spongiibacteraceae bacterium]|nr:hypothetical protein [Spongiibacteraceae bacterium]
MKPFYLLLLLALAGCVHTPPPSPPPGPDVAELQAQHRCLSALKLLNTTGRDDADYVQQRDALVASARAYQTDLIGELRELMQQKQFAQAQEKLALAQIELPISQELEQFSQQLTTAAERYRQRYLEEILQLRSATLLKEQTLYNALDKAATEPELQQLIIRQRADSEYFAAQLSQTGARALAQNELTKAVQYLGLANQLTPSPELAQQLKRAEQALFASKQKKQTARSTEREQHYRELNAIFLQNLQQFDYAGARTQLEQAKTLGIHGDELETSQEQLDSAIDRFVTQEIDAGNRLYSEGYIEEALLRWRRAAVLTPSPQLLERIDKAQRFIDRFEQLRTKK